MSDLMFNPTNTAKWMSEAWAKRTCRVVPEISMLYRSLNMQPKEMLPGGKLHVPIWASYSQGLTQMAPGSNQAVNPSISAQSAEALVDCPAVSMSQDITLETLRRMRNEKQNDMSLIIPKMKMLTASHIGVLETQYLYGRDSNGLGDISAVGPNYFDITAQNYSAGLFIDRNQARLEIWRAGVFTGQYITVYGPERNTTARVLCNPADTGKIAVGDVLRLDGSGSYTSTEMLGMIGILSEQTSLFSVDLTTIPIFKGTVIDNAAAPLSWANILTAMLKCGSYQNFDENSDSILLLSSPSFGDIVKEFQDKRNYGGDQYNAKYVQVGTMQGIEVISPYGRTKMVCHPKLKMQHALGIRLNSWGTVGVDELKLLDFGTRDGTYGPLEKIPGHLAYKFSTYSQMVPFCYEPAKNFLIKNITPSSAFQKAY